jgi:MYXO-CTERM domain-containing protein
MSGCVTGAGAAPRAAGGTWALAVLFLLTAARRRLRRIPG